MITNKKLFSEKYINLFIPGDGVEFIYSILQNSGISDFASSKSRVKGLEIISTLFSMELIEVFHWGEEHEALKNKNLSKEETLEYIEKAYRDGFVYDWFRLSNTFQVNPSGISGGIIWIHF